MKHGAQMIKSSMEQWLNPAPDGPNYGAAGGVGWLVPTKANRKIARTQDRDAKGEGASMCWVTTAMRGGQPLYVASVYVPPPNCIHNGKSRAKILQEAMHAIRSKVEKGHHVMVGGDVNMDRADMSRGRSVLDELSDRLAAENVQKVLRS